jgi:hypothetical protein
MTGLCLVALERRTDSSEDVMCDPVCPTCRNPTDDISRHECHVRYILTILRWHLLMTDPRLCSGCRRVQPLLISRITSTVKAPHQRSVHSWSRGTPTLLQLHHHIGKVRSCNTDRNIGTSLYLLHIFVNDYLHLSKPLTKQRTRRRRSPNSNAGSTVVCTSE